MSCVIVMHAVIDVQLDDAALRNADACLVCLHYALDSRTTALY